MIPSPKTRSRSGPIVTLGLLAVLVVYLLAQGPAYRLAGTNKIDPAIYEDIYAPTFWVGRHVLLFRRISVWYVRLWWRPPPPGPWYIEPIWPWDY